MSIKKKLSFTLLPILFHLLPPISLLIGISSHNRTLFTRLADENDFDVFHVRYNAANSGAEKDVFPHLNKDNRPGIVSFTATRWGQLLNEKKMPAGEPPLSASDCYRFALSNSSVDVCLSGPKNMKMMKECMGVGKNK